MHQAESRVARREWLEQYGRVEATSRRMWVKYIKKYHEPYLTSFRGSSQLHTATTSALFLLLAAFLAAVITFSALLFVGAWALKNYNKWLCLCVHNDMKRERWLINESMISSPRRWKIFLRNIFLRLNNKDQFVLMPYNFGEWVESQWPNEMKLPSLCVCAWVANSPSL